MNRAHDIRRIEIPDDYIPMYELAFLFCVIVCVTHIQAIVSVLSGYVAIFGVLIFLLYGDRRRKKEIQNLQSRRRAKCHRLEARKDVLESARLRTWVDEQAHHDPAWTTSPRLGRSRRYSTEPPPAFRNRNAAKVPSSCEEGHRTRLCTPAVCRPVYDSHPRTPVVRKMHSSSLNRPRSVSAPASPSPSPHTRFPALSSMDSTFVASTPSPDYVTPVAYNLPPTPFKVWRDDSVDNTSICSMDHTCSASCSSTAHCEPTSTEPTTASSHSETRRLPHSDPVKLIRPSAARQPMDEAWSISGNPNKFQLRGPLLLKKDPNGWEWKDHKARATRFLPRKGYRRAVN
ncbi:hypothetical protein EJ05DRAFT_501007 [Pseudovirgaria hyperparasitica]|uniref:Uncharacterized protein n=1 Tax=Pseudovirgaria hyperparasitica TaxID=470096 RepID=A0A6A6W3P0_9PEZI|nr:uncharacterized protein EJ05DRAFT_501007 [Pseudovirgaria hyperparasitica]KAF2757472.1 hypothetical protein EJ05DRAFT_501007 [Pseudovirgaria hyperparasitica]